MYEEFKKRILENGKPRFKTYIRTLCKKCKSIIEFDKSKRKIHKGYCIHCLGTEKVIRLEGKTFGTLTVIDRAKNSKQGATRWNCQCSCGNKTTVTGSSLTYGSSLSCGCVDGLSIKERLMDRIKIDKNGCWIWQGTIDKDGYGKIQYIKKGYRANRLSYMIFKGEIPKGMLVLHSCHNPKCINPKCLHLGNNDLNMKEMVESNRQAKGSKHGVSKLTEEIVKTVKEKLKTENNCATIAKEYGVHRNTILSIKKKKTWKHV